MRIGVAPGSSGRHGLPHVACRAPFARTILTIRVPALFRTSSRVNPTDCGGTGADIFDRFEMPMQRRQGLHGEVLQRLVLALACIVLEQLDSRFVGVELCLGVGCVELIAGLSSVFTMAACSSSRHGRQA